MKSTAVPAETDFAVAGCVPITGGILTVRETTLLSAVPTGLVTTTLY